MKRHLPLLVLYPSWCLAAMMTPGVLGEGSELPDGSVVISSLPFADTGDTSDNFDDPISCGASGPDVFYAFTAPSDLTLDVSLCGSSGDTVLYVLDESFVCLAFSDDACGLASRVEVALTGGALYYIGVDSHLFSGGAYQIAVEEVSGGASCPSDFNGDGLVGFADLLSILSAWGPCPPPCPFDLNGDGVVSFADLLAVLAAWGPCPVEPLMVTGCSPSTGGRGTIITITGNGFGRSSDDLCIQLIPTDPSEERLVAARAFFANETMIMAEVGAIHEDATPGRWMVAKGEGGVSPIPAIPPMQGIPDGWAFVGDGGPLFEDQCDEVFIPTPAPPTTLVVKFQLSKVSLFDNRLIAFLEPCSCPDLSVCAGFPPGVDYINGTKVTIDAHFDLLCSGSGLIHLDCYAPSLCVDFGTDGGTVHEVATALAAQLEACFHSQGATLVDVSTDGFGAIIIRHTNPACKMIQGGGSIVYDRGCVLGTCP